MNNKSHDTKMASLPVLLVLASTFPRWKDDTEPRFVFDLSIRLTDAFNVVVLTSHYSGAQRYEKWDGLEVYRYKYAPEKLQSLVYNGGIVANLAKSPWKWLLVPSFIVGQLLGILRLLKRHKVSIVHAHWLLPQAALALVARKVSGRDISILTTSHGGDLFGLKGRVATWIKCWVIDNSDSLTVVSQAMKTRVVEMSPQSGSKTQVLPMGTELNQTFYPRVDIKRDRNLIVFVGRLVEKKGVQDLIKAISKVSEARAEVKLAIIGSGPELGSLRDLVDRLDIGSIVSFEEQVSHEAIAIWFNRAGMAVFPFCESKEGDVEGLGLVMVEAMGCGAPVIAGNVDAVHDVISDGETGVVVSSRDPESVAAAIVRLLSCPALADKLSDNALLYVSEKFNWVNISNAYKLVLLECASKRVGRAA